MHAGGGGEELLHGRWLIVRYRARQQRWSRHSPLQRPEWLLQWTYD
jgi:hypothetical protein